MADPAAPKTRDELAPRPPGGGPKTPLALDAKKGTAPKPEPEKD